MLTIILIIFSMFLIYLSFCVQKTETTVLGRFKSLLFKSVDIVIKGYLYFLLE